MRFYYGLKGEIMGYLSTRQASEKWGISARRIQILCVEGRIPGAIRIGTIWGIPCDAMKPKDARIKGGRYIKGDKHSKNPGGGKS